MEGGLPSVIGSTPLLTEGAGVEARDREAEELSLSFHRAVDEASRDPPPIAAPGSSAVLALGDGEGALGALGMSDLDDLLSRLKAGAVELRATGGSGESSSG